MLRKAFVVVIGAVALAGAIALDGGKQASAKRSEASAASNGVRFQRVRISTGVELQVAQSGPANGKPVLFLHGYTDSWFSYSRILGGLSADVRAIVPTQRGHGDSQRPKCCYLIADFAKDAVALLDALGIERADVVGHSMGSFVAQRIAIDYPDRVGRLVLIGSGTTVATPLVSDFNQAVQALPDTVSIAFARDFQVSTAHAPLPPAFLDTVVQESRKLPGWVWRSVLAGLLSGDARAELAKIQANTLIVWGEHDTFWDRKQQDALARAIPRARLLTYSHVAHSPHWEDPDLFARDLSAFLNEPERNTAQAREAGAHEHGAKHTGGTMPLLEGLGTWQHAVTTSSREAQKYFDQGLNLVYAFNHDQAVRSFERAVQLDPACAMCYWGIAYALGPNINLPMAAAIEPRALEAISKARKQQRVTAHERALIDAMARRFGVPAGAARAARDSAYAAAMRGVAQRYPDDVDTQVIFADALLNLRPWNQWTTDGQPQPGTMELVAALERALAREPNHAGACHLYVHAVEASNTPERALPCAERLPKLMPGAGHIVHMPAHTFLRMGRYEDAARANIAAVEADHRYFAQHDVEPGVYPMFYAPHNLHFLWATYLLSGQQTKALQAAQSLVGRVAVENARTYASLEALLSTVFLTRARFADWGGVLAEPAPPSELRYMKALWHHARGLAFSAQGNVRAAGAELDSLRAIAAKVPADMIIILNPASKVLTIAAEVLAGDIALNQKQFDQAIAHLQKAAQIEDALNFDEPPPWHHSTRNRLGEAFLAAGRAAEAETAFRADLSKLRENGWSLAGLERALRRQGKGKEANAVAVRFREAWKYSDMKTN
jgi:pimeloyl-ACP methyl ester carboxylesterase/tetratricopeptide (TPR) repeat protein